MLSGYLQNCDICVSLNVLQVIPLRFLCITIHRKKESLNDETNKSSGK